MRLFIKDRFWFVFIILACLVEFKLLAQLLVDHISHSIVRVILLAAITLGIFISIAIYSTHNILPYIINFGLNRNSPGVFFCPAFLLFYSFQVFHISFSWSFTGV